MPPPVKQEIWKSIAGYEGCYEISDYGQVRSLSRIVAFRNCMGTLVTRQFQSRLLKCICNYYGYAIVGLYDPIHHRRRQHKIHRLVLNTFVGPCPPGQEGRHLDGDKLNNQLGNLCWGTSKENNADRVVHGTSNQGERHGSAKLTNDKVRQIRKLRSDGWAYLKIAHKYKVDRVAVMNIVKRKSWKHVP